MKKSLAVLACTAAAVVAPLASTAPASAVPLELGSVQIPLPDLAPVPVGTPFGLPVAALPALPYPLQWVGGAPAAPVDAFGGRTAVLDCGGRPQKVPGEIVVFCGDGTRRYTDIRWESWTDASATGTATRVSDDCVPNCARGTWTRRPVRVTLHDVRQRDGAPVFGVLTVRDGDRTYDERVLWG